jgi:ribosomal small subunit protein bTHX
METSMGKGDTRTRRGKTNNGSYGKKRPHRIRKTTKKKK